MGDCLGNHWLYTWYLYDVDCPRLWKAYLLVTVLCLECRHLVDFMLDWSSSRFEFHHIFWWISVFQNAGLSGKWVQKEGTFFNGYICMKAFSLCKVKLVPFSQEFWKVFSYFLKFMGWSCDQFLQRSLWVEIPRINSVN